MKAKHNKKRNTAFLFEALVRELTKSFVSKNAKRSKKVKSILQQHFKKGSPLHEELSCYKALQGDFQLDHYTAEKMIFRAKNKYDTIEKKEIFKEQSEVVGKINKALGKEVYSNFVPDYKTYATLSQIFGDKISVKNRVLLEKQILETLTTENSNKEELKHVDSLVVKSFTKRFNDKYVDLLPEQCNLLEQYVLSFGPNEADFRLLVGRELTTIKEKVENSLNLKEVRDDEQMVSNTKKLLEKLNSMCPLLEQERL